MFVEQDFKFLTELFSLARLQIVTSQPQNRQALENIMNYEVILKDKMSKTNDTLNVAESEEVSEDNEKFQEETIQGE